MINSVKCLINCLNQLDPDFYLDPYILLTHRYKPPKDACFKKFFFSFINVQYIIPWEIVSEKYPVSHNVEESKKKVPDPSPLSRSAPKGNGVYSGPGHILCPSLWKSIK